MTTAHAGIVYLVVQAATGPERPVPEQTTNTYTELSDV